MGSFGFGFIGRNNLRVARLEPGQPERLVGDFNGSVNRVMVWDLNGRVLHEADLGFGIRAFGGIPYAKTMLRNTNVRGLELPDFDGDGVKSIAAASPPAPASRAARPCWPPTAGFSRSAPTPGSSGDLRFRTVRRKNKRPFLSQSDIFGKKAVSFRNFHLDFPQSGCILNKYVRLSLLRR